MRVQFALYLILYSKYNQVPDWMIELLYINSHAVSLSVTLMTEEFWYNFYLFS